MSLRTEALIVWFTGLSGAGKSTLATRLHARLEASGQRVILVDGDVFRQERARTDVFTREAIIRNNIEIIEHCRLASQKFDIVLVAVIAPFSETRELARRTIGDRYVEIFVECGMETLIRRDTKGLYAQALSCTKSDVIGISRELPYERPTSPEVTVKTDELSIEAALGSIEAYLRERVAQLKY